MREKYCTNKTSYEKDQIMEALQQQLAEADRLVDLLLHLSEKYGHIPEEYKQEAQDYLNQHTK